MKAYMRRAAVLVLSLALIGCGGAKPQGSSTIGGGKPVELNLLMGAGFSMETTQAIIETYMRKYPNVHITLKDIQTRQFFSQDGQANASVLDGIDVALVQGNLALRLAQANALKDLSGVRLPALNETIAPYYDDLSKLDGKRYGLPISIGAGMMMINEQALTQAGLKLPSVDWTVQEFEQLLISLKAAGVNFNVSASAILDPLVHAYGAQMYDSARKVWSFDTPEAAQAFGVMQRLVQAGLVSTQGGGTIVFAAPAGGGAPGQAVQGNRVGGGGAGGGPGGFPALIALGDNFIQRGPGTTMQPYPKGPRGRGSTASAVMAVVIGSSANPEVAADFAKEMVASATIQTAIGKSGSRPVSADQGALAAWREGMGDRTAQAMELALQGAYPSPGVGLNQAITELLPYFNGTATLEQTVPAALAKLPT